MSRELLSTQPNVNSWRRRVAGGVLGAIALVSGVAAAEHFASATPVNCDPVIDNNCHPGGPGSTLPTLPEKGETTTVPPTTQPPETTVPPTTQPPETTVPPTTHTTPSLPTPTAPPTTHVVIVPPRQQQAPHGA